MRPVGWNERGIGLIEWELGARACGDLVAENTGSETLTENIVRTRAGRFNRPKPETTSIYKWIGCYFGIKEKPDWLFLGERIVTEREGRQEILAVVDCADRVEAEGQKWYIPEGSIDWSWGS